MDLFLAQKAAIIQSILCRDVPRTKMYQILESTTLKRSEHIMDLASLNIQSTIPIWRILILDNDSSRIISKLFTKSELLDLGVTLTLGISTDKDRVEDLVAVYICSSNDNNLKQISKDISLKLYSKYSISFLDVGDNSVLERFQLQLSNSAIKSSAISTKDNKNGEVLGISSLSCNYNCLQSDLFSLTDETNIEMDTDYFGLLNVNKENSTEAERIIVKTRSSKIAQKLFNQIVTLYLNGKSNFVPILCKPKNSTYFTNCVFEKLKEKIKGFFKLSQNNVYYLFVLEDRARDITPFLVNSNTYHAMLSDYLQVKNNFLIREDGNRVFITGEDIFWEKYKSKHFQEVVEGLKQEVNRYKNKSNDILSTSKSDMQIETEEIQVIKALKKSIDLHSFQLDKLTEVLKSKGIIELVNLEEDVMGNVINKEEIDKILNDETFTESEVSKLCYLLYMKNYNKFGKFKENEHFQNCLATLKQYKEVKAKMENKGSSRVKGSFIEQIASKVTQTTSKIMKSLINTNLKFQLNKGFVELLENFENEQATYDVFSLNENLDTDYNQGVLFIAGGGSLNEINELENFMENLNKDSKLHLIYGCSNIYNSNEWVEKFVRKNK